MASCLWPIRLEHFVCAADVNTCVSMTPTGATVVFSWTRLQIGLPSLRSASDEGCLTHPADKDDGRLLSIRIREIRRTSGSKLKLLDTSAISCDIPAHFPAYILNCTEQIFAIPAGGWSWYGLLLYYTTTILYSACQLAWWLLKD